MEPHKLDKEFREKLNAREILPSDKAWDRLDAMLAVNEKQTPVRRLNWPYIAAAAFLGFAFIGTLFFNSDIKQDPAQPVVTKTKETISLPVEKTINQISTPSANETEKVQKTNTKIAVKVLKSDTFTQQDKSQIVNHLATSVKSIIPENPKPIIHPQAANVDELLATVEPQKENLKRPSLKVDATALLSQVNGELELSFREKVIGTVSKKYQNVKVALANRNQE